MVALLVLCAGLQARDFVGAGFRVTQWPGIWICIGNLLCERIWYCTLASIYDDTQVSVFQHVMAEFMIKPHNN